MTDTAHATMETALLPLHQNDGMSPELKALVEKVARSICCPEGCEVVGCKGFRFKTREALAAIRCVAEATRKASVGMLVAAHEEDDNARAFEGRQASEASDCWRAMHAASVLGEALRND